MPPLPPPRPAAAPATPRRLPDALSALAARVWRGHGLPAVLDGLPIALGSIPAPARPAALSGFARVLQQAAPARVSQLLAAGELRGQGTSPAPAASTTPMVLTLVALSHAAGDALAATLADPAAAAALCAGDRRPLEALRAPGVVGAVQAALAPWAAHASGDRLDAVATQHCRQALAIAVTPYLPPADHDPAAARAAADAVWTALAQAPAPAPEAPLGTRVSAAAVQASAACVAETSTGDASADVRALLAMLPVALPSLARVVQRGRPPVTTPPRTTTAVRPARAPERRLPPRPTP